MEGVAQGPHEVESRHHPGLLSSGGLTGAEGFAAKMAHSHGRCQEASVSCYAGLPFGLLVCPHDVVAGFPHGR